MHRFQTRITLASALMAFMAMGAAPAAAQTFTACRVPDVGAIYMIGVAGAPGACLDASHIEFSWTEGGGSVGPGEIDTEHLADMSVTPEKIASDNLWDFGGVDGQIRFHGVFGDGGGGTTLLGSFGSTAWPAPQVRFEGSSGTGFWDIGLNPSGDFTFELDDVEECALFTGGLGWSCPATIPVDGVTAAEIAADAVGASELGLEVITANASGNTSASDILTAACSAGKTVIGGGYWVTGISGALLSDFTTTANYPSSATSWTVTGRFPAAPTSWSWNVYAVCVMD